MRRTGTPILADPGPDPAPRAPARSGPLPRFTVPDRRCLALCALLLAGPVFPGPGPAFAEPPAPPASYGEAMRWYEQQARAGSARAQYFMGEIAASGLRGVADPVAAADWFEKAAQQGHGLAQFRLGLAYQAGHGREADPRAALRWFSLAARQGVAEAQFNLARMHEMGLGIPANPAQAALLYRQAAESGLGEAAFNLGLMYWEGQGVARDLSRAWAWLTLARERGVHAAVEPLAALDRVIGDDERERAKRFLPGS